MKLTRRNFLRLALYATPAVAFAEAKFIEPTWLKVRQLRVGTAPAMHRFVHFTDLHHKGDRAYLQAVVAQINALKPDFVCFTGDIVERAQYLDEALEWLRRIQAPLFGVPGNHDYWSNIPFGPVRECFRATGGDWLLNEHRPTPDGKSNLMGLTGGRLFAARDAQAKLPLDATKKNLLLMHYPAWANYLGDQKCDLLLAGHSHGGQVRLPFLGAVVTPTGVEGYDLGFFQTPAGPLYVGAGIGWFHLNLRFNCRPEITVIEI